MGQTFLHHLPGHLPHVLGCLDPAGHLPATVLLGLAELTKDETDRLAGSKPLAMLRLGGLLRWARGLGQGRIVSLRRWALAAIGLEVVLLGLFIMGLVTGGGEAGQA